MRVSKGALRAECPDLAHGVYVAVLEQERRTLSSMLGEEQSDMPNLLRTPPRLYSTEHSAVALLELDKVAEHDGCGPLSLRILPVSCGTP